MQRRLDNRLSALEHRDAKKPELVITFAGMYDQSAPGAWGRPQYKTFEEAYLASLCDIKGNKTQHQRTPVANDKTA